MLESHWHQIQKSSHLSKYDDSNGIYQTKNDYFVIGNNEVVNLSCSKSDEKFKKEITNSSSDFDDSMDSDDFKPLGANFSITENIKKSSRNYHNFESEKNINSPADQNNNENHLYIKLRDQQMQQLLKQNVLSPHQLQQLIGNQLTMSNPKESLFHFEQKRKQMELLMHQIQEQLHANVLQQTHLLQQQSPNGENPKKSSTYHLQQKLAIQQQELAQQFQLIQRQYLLHQSGMQLLFPQYHQQHIPNLPHCNDFHSNSDDGGHKTHSSDATKGHLFDTEMNAKLNRNDTNNNSNINNNENDSNKDKDEEKDEKISEINGTREESPKLKTEGKDENYISQFLNSIMNFRRDEMNLSLNNLLAGANQQQSNFLLNDLNRNFLLNSSDHVNHALNNLVAGHQQYQKYGRGTCKYPGCDLIFDDLQTFTKHLNTEHSMDDCTTAQARIQMQVVFQLEIQLQKEKDRLQAMMHHLHLTKESMAAAALEQRNQNNLKTEAVNKIAIIDEPFMQSSTQNPSPQRTSPNQQNSRIRSPLHNVMPIRRRITDKSAMSLSGLPYMLERAGLDVQQEIQRNREFYKSADVRPPFTYASLIRQNAIRTNLSLHKCFVRYEDDFGSFWMVDDNEFVKRRHLSRGRPRNPQGPPTSANGNQGEEGSTATTTGGYRSPNSTPSTNFIDDNIASPTGSVVQLNLQRSGQRGGHSPQNNIYSENMAINLQNFWLSPTNLLDDNGMNHIKHDKFRSQSLSPSRSPSGPQSLNNSHDKLDNHMDMISYTFEHHRRKHRLVSPKSHQKERFFQNREIPNSDESQNTSSYHQVENLVKHEISSNYGDDYENDDEISCDKMDEEVEDLSKN